MATWRFLFVSTYPPNAGGIASFTRDLVQAVADGAVNTGSGSGFGSAGANSLSGASLSGTSLSGASLSGASLSGASLSGASLSGASLSGSSSAAGGFSNNLADTLAEAAPSHRSPLSGAQHSAAQHSSAAAHSSPETQPLGLMNSPVAVADVAALEASWGSTWGGSNSSSSRDDPRVVMTADPRREGDLLRLAHDINASHYDTVCVQHDFSVFPADVAGELVGFFRACRRPKVVTFHSVPAAPDPNVRHTLRTLAELSFACVVMTRRAAEILQQQYGVDSARIMLIPHGTPAIRFGHRPTIRHDLDLEGRRVITSFGLLARNKGIEYLIDAMDRVSSQHPEAICLVLGRTAPETVALEGESYREELTARAARLRRADTVRFVNRFLPTTEVCSFLQASDLVVTPYLNPDQTTSGTLANALAAGKAIVSTPYLHAREALADERGLLVPFRDASSLAGALTGLLSNRHMTETLERRAYLYARRTQWSVVGRHYLELLAEAGLTLRLVAVPLGGRSSGGVGGSGSGHYRVYRAGEANQAEQHTEPTQTGTAHTVPAHTVPAHTVPAHTLPAHTLPAHTVPVQTVPRHATTPKAAMSHKLGLGGDSRVLPTLNLPRSPRRNTTPSLTQPRSASVVNALSNSSESFELPAGSLTEQSAEGPAVPRTPMTLPISQESLSTPSRDGSENTTTELP